MSKDRNQPAGPAEVTARQLARLEKATRQAVADAETYARLAREAGDHGTADTYTRMAAALRRKLTAS